MCIDEWGKSCKWKSFQILYFEWEHCFVFCSYPFILSNKMHYFLSPNLSLDSMVKINGKSLVFFVIIYH